MAIVGIAACLARIHDLVRRIIVYTLLRSRHNRFNYECFPTLFIRPLLQKKCFNYLLNISTFFYDTSKKAWWYGPMLLVVSVGGGGVIFGEEYIEYIDKGASISCLEILRNTYD